MDIIIGIIIGLVILALLVAVHELGHAVAARRNGVVVEEFGIGFPPKAWAKKLKNGTLFTLNWLPLGGFVKLKGEYDSSRGKGTYGVATFWQKTKILLAGVLMNWIIAAVLFTGLAFVGIPKILPNQFVVQEDTYSELGDVLVGYIKEDSAADRAGLLPGDEIRQIGDKQIVRAADVTDYTQAHKGEDTVISYIRDGDLRQVDTTLGVDESAGILGAGISQHERLRATWSAPIVGVGTTIQLSWATLEGIGQLLANLATGIVKQLSFDESTRTEGSANIEAAGQSVAGPIGILGVIFPAASQAGIEQLIFLTAIISLTLAVMNILPIPAFDGGRWFTLLFFRLFKQKLTKEREERIQMIGVMIILGLIVLVTIADVARFFS